MTVHAGVHSSRDTNSTGRGWARGVLWPHEPRLVVRVAEADDFGAGAVEATNIVPISPFRRSQVLGMVPRVVRELHHALRNARVVYIKVPGLLGMIAGEIAHHNGTPLVIDVVGDVGRGPSPFARGLRGHLVRLVQGAHAHRLLTRAAAVRFVSSALRRSHPEVPADRLVVGDDMVSTEWGGQHSPDALSSGPVVYVASLQHFKGHADLLTAIDILRDEGLRPHVRLIGDGPHEAEIRRDLTKRDLQSQVALEGWLPREEVEEAVLSATCVVLASRTEGMPRSVLEALSLGTPTYASAVGGVSEVLPADQSFAPGDCQALADLLRWHLTDPQRRASVAAASEEAGRAASRRRARSREQWQEALDAVLHAPPVD